MKTMELSHLLHTIFRPFDYNKENKTFIKLNRTNLNNYHLSLNFKSNLKKLRPLFHKSSDDSVKKLSFYNHSNDSIISISTFNNESNIFEENLNPFDEATSSIGEVDSNSISNSISDSLSFNSNKENVSPSLNHLSFSFENKTSPIKQNHSSSDMPISLDPVKFNQTSKLPLESSTVVRSFRSTRPIKLRSINSPLIHSAISRKLGFWLEEDVDDNEEFDDDDLSLFDCLSVVEWKECQRIIIIQAF